MGQHPPHPRRAPRCGHRTVRRVDRPGRRHRAVDRTDARYHDRHHHTCRDSPARRPQRGSKGQRRRTRPLVSAGPIILRDLQHRRQHRDQRRRAVLRQVRRHHRLRARDARRPGRRHDPATGRTSTERCCWTESYKTLRRQRRIPRSDHRGHAAATAPTTAAVHRGGDVQYGARGGRRGAGDHRTDPAVDAGIHGLGGDQRGRGQTEDGAGPRRRRHARRPLG